MVRWDRFAALLLVVAALGSPPRAHSGDPAPGLVPRFEGTLYEPGSGRHKVLFRWKLWSNPDWNVRRSVYTTPDGEVATTEEILLEDGVFRRYTLVHHGAGERGSIERIGDRLRFSYTRNGRTKTDEERMVSNFVAGPLLVQYLQRHWDTILRGDAVEIRLGVPDRRETVGFEVSLRERRRVEGRERFVLEMEPSSFLIAAIVDPILLVMSQDGRTVYEVIGRATPLGRAGNDWKPVEAEAVYRSVQEKAQLRPPPPRGLEGPEGERSPLGGGP